MPFAFPTLQAHLFGVSRHRLLVRHRHAVPGRPGHRLLLGARELVADQDARWRPSPPGSESRRVLYTHESHEGGRRPIAFDPDSPTWRYLLTHRRTLEARAYVREAGRRWYEIWVPHDPADWSRPKIVFPDISDEPRFGLDRHGRVVHGNCYWITTRDGGEEDLLLLMLGVANSAPMRRYHDLAFPNRLYSGRRRYLTQFVARYPLPDPAHPASRDIVGLVRTLCDPSTPSPEIRALEAAVDGKVSTTLELPADSISA